MFSSLHILTVFQLLIRALEKFDHVPTTNIDRSCEYAKNFPKM